MDDRKYDAQGRGRKDVMFLGGGLAQYPRHTKEAPAPSKCGGFPNSSLNQNITHILIGDGLGVLKVPDHFRVLLQDAEGLVIGQ